MANLVNFFSQGINMLINHVMHRNIWNSIWKKSPCLFYSLKLKTTPSLVRSLHVASQKRSSSESMHKPGLRNIIVSPTYQTVCKKSTASPQLTFEDFKNQEEAETIANIEELINPGTNTDVIPSKQEQTELPDTIPWELLGKICFSIKLVVISMIIQLISPTFSSYF